MTETKEIKGRLLHLKGLNGLRAIAAIGVVLSHTTLALGRFGLDAKLFGTAEDGSPKGLLLAGFGVSIFFGLSGFLITYLLLLEKEKANTVQIRKFYLRRILRIWPLYYLFFAVYLMVAWASGMSVDWKAFWFYVFFAANIPFALNFAIPDLAHYWSIGVEEQFYLFWPWLMRIRRLRTIKLILVLSVAFLLVFKTLLRFELGDESWIYKFVATTRFQCMMIGAIGAVLYYEQVRWFWSLATSLWMQSVSWLVVLAIILNRFHIASFLDNEIVSVVTVMLIMGQVTGRNRLINLENKVCDFLGKLSYGIYIIHPLIITGLAYFATLTLHLPRALGYVSVFFAVLLFTVIAAYVSYRWIESPFLKLKNRHAVVKTAASSEDNSSTSETAMSEAADDFSVRLNGQ